jgi:colanic acid biosynthesis protein WcaH
LKTYAEPGKDLPEELFLFVSSITPLVNVDLLIKDKDNRTLLTWRDDEFYGKGWHVPGGIIRFKELAQERVAKVAEQELGCSVKPDGAPMLVTESFSPHLERGHFISLLFRCELLTDPAPSLKSAELPNRGQWRWHSGVPRDLLPAHEFYASLF